MPTTAQAAEADRVTEAFHAALTALGVQSVVEALALWNEVPVDMRAGTAARWLDSAVDLVLSNRAGARELAVAYYRLVRALYTGRTIPDPSEPQRTSVTLDELRTAFDDLAQSASPGPARPSTTEDTTDAGSTPQAGAQPADEVDPDSDAELDRILIEELEQLEADYLAEQERIEREAEEEARLVLEALGTENLKDKLDAIDGEQPANDVDQQREDAHGQAGSRQAAAVERLVQNGARSQLWVFQNGDQRALGYVRFSTTGTPCGWCAMLISRGPVYKSEASAMFDEGDLYHDNCHCIAVPVWTREQYETSPLFDLNRQYGESWPRVTSGLSGKSALSAWRRFIRQTQQAEAQEADRRSQTAQEA